MAGHGPPPKDPATRARGKRSDVIPLRVITQSQVAEQPLLPADFDWHPQTIIWWHKLRESPMSRDYTTLDWQYLLDTAFIHTKFWEGDMKAASELRLRAANFGSTPADRARLRVQIVTAEEVEEKAEARRNGPASRGKYKTPEAG